MKKLFIVANWKSNKTTTETESWLQELKINDLLTNKEIIICPSFIALPILKSLIINHKSRFNRDKSLIKLGAQNISPFSEGAYTGEVNGRQIKEFADYVLIGHSERRKEFKENNEMIQQKIAMATKYDLIPILCVSNITQLSALSSQLSALNFLVAYEPLFAIGSGNPDTPENANVVAAEIKKILNAPVLYGGSVAPENAQMFTKMPFIDGVLVGGASLNAKTFFSIIQNA